MTRAEFNAFCAGLPAASHAVQWGKSDVWKVGGKVFAVCGWSDGDAAFTFKAGEIAHLFERLDEFESEGTPLSDRLNAMWVNSGGGKHHEGTNYHPVVLVGAKDGPLRGGRFLEVGGGHAISDVYLAVAQAMGVKTDPFGDPGHLKGPFPGLL